jgi:hypothetical protein
MNDDTPVAQVFVEGDLGNGQALGNLSHTQLLFTVEGLSNNSRALGLFGEPRWPPPTRSRAREASPTWVRSRSSLLSVFGDDPYSLQ